ncbi:MAG TPA: vanadium-dependent haloperoxidase [Puia sp.]|nr:vanadium-dependent haloperoxidase [Puia sp.]
MKHSNNWPAGRRALRFQILICLAIGCIIGCKKPSPILRDGLTASAYPGDVIDKWLTLELRLIKDAKGIGNGAFARPFAYSGICAFESTDPGKASWKGKYNGLSGLPSTDKLDIYHWPSSVNASLAEFNRLFFTTVNSSQVDIAAIDSLEAAINTGFSELPPAVANVSENFGKTIADAVFAWSQTDGYAQNNALAYTPAVGPGLWVPTPPAFGKASGPYWGNDRPIIAGSGDNAQPPAPTPYSEDPNSSFYQMVNDLYTASKNLTPDQKNWALFWQDVPGPTTPGHWMSIMQQVIAQTHSRLDKASMTFALVGICLNDAVISVFKTKYTYNLIRPVSYIRKVIGDTGWLPPIATPAHPEYSAAHAVVSASAADALTWLYGNIGPFTDHTDDYLDLPARSFDSFTAIANDAGNSRFYGGIHYQPSINIGLKQGWTVADNILGSLGLSTGKKY